MPTNTFRNLRRAACMTQAHLAKAAGVSLRSIQRMEAGVPAGAETLRAVCSVLGGNAADHARSSRRPASVAPIPVVWSDDLVDQVAALWRSGMGGEAIALKLGRGLTKNGVICKMYRQGLAFGGGAGYGATDEDGIAPYPHVGGPHRGGPPEPAGCPA